jgi:hypothetical protein
MESVMDKIKAIVMDKIKAIRTKYLKRLTSSWAAASSLFLVLASAPDRRATGDGC